MASVPGVVENTLLEILVVATDHGVVEVIGSS
jgi:hypothetical protein